MLRFPSISCGFYSSFPQTVAFGRIFSRPLQLNIIALNGLICQVLTFMLNLDVAVAFHTGASRDQLTNDDIFLQAHQRVHLALDSGIGEHSGGLLEGGCGQEGICCQRSLGDTQQDRNAGGFPQSVSPVAIRSRIFSFSVSNSTFSTRSWAAAWYPRIFDRTFFIICRTITSMCLSLISTPCIRYTRCTS